VKWGRPNADVALPYFGQWGGTDANSAAFEVYNDNQGDAVKGRKATGGGRAGHFRLEGGSADCVLVISTSATSGGNALLARNLGGGDALRADRHNINPPYARLATADGWAGWFEGNVRITGNLTKGGGGFRVDHPLDPESKYLNHSFVESPERMNVYNGTAALDASGGAVVRLPEWFEVVNRDFRYQLTAIGAPMPNLHVAAEVTNSEFKIAGGKPGGKVSWQVTGVRCDPWAEANPLVVEEDKPAEERGYYLHPELYGEPAERSVDRARKAAGQE
jgi:hypothetical protein